MIRGLVVIKKVAIDSPVVMIIAPLRFLVSLSSQYVMKES
jgi:hypothetical protein